MFEMSVEKELIQVTVRRWSSSASDKEAELNLEVRPDQTVGETKQQVHALDSSIAVDDILLDGVKVDDGIALSAFSKQDSPLIFTAERRSIEVAKSTARPKRKRCSVRGCISAPLRGVGDCTNCDGHFCSRHRLMEQHHCQGLQGCKQQLHERNALRLQQQQTLPNKV